MDSGKALDIVKTVAIVVGGYYVVKTLSSVGGGIGDALSEEPEEAGTSQDVNCDNLRNLTHQDFVYRVAADQIQTAVWDAPFGMWEDDSTIRDALMIAYTLDDVIKLSCEYGTRGAKDAVSNTYNLAQTVSAFLNDWDKEDVNDLYASRGIPFAW